MERYICLRDDDTNYYTTPQELQEAYGFIWGLYPITLATVPFAHGSESKIMDYDTQKDKFSALRQWEINASCKELTEYHKVHPIGDNRELILYLKEMIKSGMVEIAQHGVFHKYNERGAEMYYDRISFEDVQSGKEYLQKTFETDINIFIPPSNSIDEVCTGYIDKLGMKLFSSGSIKYTSKKAMISSYMHDRSALVEKISSLVSRQNRPIRRRNGILVFGSSTYNVFDKKEVILDKVQAELFELGFAALGTHYRLLAEKDYREQYHDVIKSLSKIDGVKFVTASEYYKLMKEKYYE